MRYLLGDCRDVLRSLPEGSFQCCVTSPPYYGLRDYGVSGQIGLEPTPDDYVAEMVAVFREVRRVLRDDGTLWLNLGDSYNAGTSVESKPSKNKTDVGYWQKADRIGRPRTNFPGIKTKDLCGIPWMIAFALRADGWYLRSDIIWHKPNPMPESVRDRPTSAHEHVFLLSRSPRYFYDAEAVAEPLSCPGAADGTRVFGGKSGTRNLEHGKRTEGRAYTKEPDGGRNARNVWAIATQPYSGAHFATMPVTLAERRIKAGSAAGDSVIDPFGGAATTAIAADRLGRSAVVIDLNPEYKAMAEKRLLDDRVKRLPKELQRLL